MEALLLPLDFEAALIEFQKRRGGDRTRGRHQSEIIHRIVAHLDPKRFGKDGLDPALMHGGFVWEDVLSIAFAKQFRSRQIEIETDGILQTLDDFDIRKWRVREFKMTKMSAANDIRSAKFLHWHMQGMGYCKGMGTKELELIPLFINGSYELGGGRFGKPVVGRDNHPFLIRYTQREIDENWDGLRRERDDMDQEEEESGE